MTNKRDLLASTVRCQIDDMVTASFYGTSTTLCTTVKAFKPPADLIGDIYRMATKLGAQMRRTNVTVTVDAWHIGPALLERHPTDGVFVECDYFQAMAIGSIAPLRLVRVLSAGSSRV